MEATHKLTDEQPSLRLANTWFCMVRTMTRSFKRSSLLLLALALFAAACGDSGSSSDNGIATLTDGDTAVADVDAPGELETTSEEAALAFAQCMRDGGIDFPDPTVDEEGNPSFEDAFRAGGDGELDFRSEDFREVIGECQELTEGLAFGGGRGGFDPSEIQEALLPYTECLRDEGLDVGDFSFAQGGPGGAPDDDGAQGGGQRGPGGDPSTRIARALGLDIDDPAVAEAIEACSPLLEEAFAGFAGRN